MISHFLTLILLLLLVVSSTQSSQHYGSLWCHQGSKKEFEPAQCEAQTLDCFKFTCQHQEAAFVARGCGVSLGRTATGLKNESCYQALAQCQAINGTGSCEICSDKHMCNGTPAFSIISICIFVLLKIF